MKKKNFLKRYCPFDFYGERITWGELIKDTFEAAMLLVVMFCSYLIMLGFADYIGVK